VFLSKHRADRFLLWWLFLHRRLRSRQRGLLAFACKRLLLLPGGSLPKSVVRFYPSNLKKFFNLFVSKPFGFDSRRNSNFFPSLCCSQTMRHRSACLSLYRSKARKHWRALFLAFGLAACGKQNQSPSTRSHAVHDSSAPELMGPSVATSDPATVSPDFPNVSGELTDRQRPAQIALSPARFHGSGLELKHDKAGVSATAPQDPSVYRRSGSIIIRNYDSGLNM
jgi:hypothetical protein